MAIFVNYPKHPKCFFTAIFVVGYSAIAVFSHYLHQFVQPIEDATITDAFPAAPDVLTPYVTTFLIIFWAFLLLYFYFKVENARNTRANGCVNTDVCAGAREGVGAGVCALVEDVEQNENNENDRENLNL